jgi:enhancing lycopene biosynthesis protein 2
MLRRAAVLLSGNGVYDGTECMEACALFFSLHEAGFKFQCYAPDMDQFHVLNHTNGEVQNETRNVLVESARLCRGNIKPLTDLTHSNYDALFMPGGFGAAKNLSSFGYESEKMTVHPEATFSF